MTEQIVTEKEIDNTLSICDIMKSNTSEVIKKIEAQIPSYFQLYSDFYKEYLHTLDDLFGTCYISEKEFFDKLGYDQNTLKIMDSYWKSWTNFSIFQIEASTNILKSFLQLRLGTMKSYESFIHQIMDSYAKMLSSFNANLQK